MSTLKKRSGWLGFGAGLLLAAPAVAQESLPFPPTPSGSTAGPTLAESTYNPLPRKFRICRKTRRTS